ncbi:NCK-interacting protein with SH3 domain [Paragonimus heterotremus]|uniref:NCK-interacting protein with SH3 domain n=1 Tax=Paragonimus heterotremus TaxID=100268 RepID=A0A8J4TPF5_9TREM|nr:NCK-interacting protein with SH3 domain [Paragonimus heterotremus]
MLESEVPDLHPYTSVLQTLLANSTTEECRLSYTLSPDWHSLNLCLGKLLKFQQDDQERNWSLHDEQTELEQVLVVLIDVLMKADRELLRYYFKFSNYRPLQSMLQLYQSESRALIRRKLLLCIGMICSLDDACSRVVLASVLPHELIRELATVDNDADVRHIATGMRLLTLLLAQAKELPVDVKDKLNVDFLAKILWFIGSIEEPQVTSLIDLDPFDASVSTKVVAQKKLFNGRLAHAATVLLLACNWHFCSATAARMNQSTTRLPLIEALMAQPSASKCFLELVIQAFNRDLDPIVFVDFKCPVNENRINRLICWIDAVSGKSSAHTNQDGFEIPDNSLIAKVFEGLDEESNTSLIDDDDGLYARLLWVDSLNIRERPVPLTTLPTGAPATTPCHSVVKLLFDLFGSVETAGLVYGNDQDVVVDVITRQLCNLSFKDSQRIFNYPVLLSLIIANSDYVARGAHRGRELITGLSTLLTTELPDEVNTACSTRGLDLARISLQLLRSALQKG